MSLVVGATRPKGIFLSALFYTGKRCLNLLLQETQTTLGRICVLTDTFDRSNNHDAICKCLTTSIP